MTTNIYDIYVKSSLQPEAKVRYVGEANPIITTPNDLYDLFISKGSEGFMLFDYIRKTNDAWLFEKTENCQDDMFYRFNNV